MHFGSSQAFAIEAMTEPNLSAPSAVWGRMRVWCQGTPIGDFDEPHCALYPAYLNFGVLKNGLPSLWLPEFEGLTDAALCNHLDGLLYGCHGDEPIEDDRDVEQCRRDGAVYGRFDFLTNWGEQFDRAGKSFIVCTPGGTVRVLNRQFPGRMVREATLGETVAAIDQYLGWFQAEANRLSGKPESASCAMPRAGVTK